MGRIERVLIEVETEIESWTSHLRRVLKTMNPYVFEAALMESGTARDLVHLHRLRAVLRSLRNEECRWEDDGGPCPE